MPSQVNCFPAHQTSKAAERSKMSHAAQNGYGDFSQLPFEALSDMTLLLSTLRVPGTTLASADGWVVFCPCTRSSKQCRSM